MMWGRALQTPLLAYALQQRDAAVVAAPFGMHGGAAKAKAASASTAASASMDW